MNIKIFISYGHKDATQLAIKLKKELIIRGFDVWLDSSNIKGGKEWEQQIIDGIKSSDIMISLLSPHSTRVKSQNNDEDSVCLDELSFARYEPPPTPIIPILAIKGAIIPLTIHRLHYLDFTDSLSSKSIFEKKFKELLLALDSSLKGDTLYRSWETWLTPILEFDRFLYTKHRNFIGREWLFKEIELWRKNESEQALLIVGDPGIGKSSIISALSYSMFDGATIVTYCCQWDVKATLNPANFVKTVAYQLAVRLPEYALKIENFAIKNILENSEKDPSSAFEQGILTPLNSLKTLSSELPFFICIDSLDEAITYDEKENIVNLLESRIERFPSWLKIIATTRNDPNIKRKFGGLRTKIINASGEENLKDITSYISLKIEEVKKKTNIEIENKEEYISSFLKYCEGNFLYTEHYFQGILRDNANLNELSNFPSGLNGTYQRFLQRVFPTNSKVKEIVPILEVLCATREGVERNLLAELLNVTERELIKLLVPLMPFLSQKQSEKGEPLFSLWHKSFYDFLTSMENADSEFGIDHKKGSCRISSLFIKKILNGSSVEYRGNIKLCKLLERDGLNHLALCGKFFDGLTEREITKLIYYSSLNVSLGTVGSLSSFALIFIQKAIKNKPFNTIKQMINGLDETIRLHYIDSGVIKVENIDGIKSNILTGKATNSASLARAFNLTSSAIVIANEVLSYYGKGDEFEYILEQMNSMRYMVGGFDVAGWGSDVSGYFSDQGGFLYSTICELKEGKNVPKYSV